MTGLTGLRTLALGGLIAAAMSAPAYATTFGTDDPGGHFTLGTGWVGQGDTWTLNIRWAVDGAFADQVFDLENVGDMYTTKYGTAHFAGESRISAFEADNLEITAHVDLVLPESLELMSIGVVGVVLGPTGDDDEDVRVAFTPTEVGYGGGNGGKLGLELSDVIFYDDHMLVDIHAKFTLLEAYKEELEQKRDPDPKIEPVDGTGNTTTVPEPGTLALLGFGLAGLGVMRRRKLA